MGNWLRGLLPADEAASVSATTHAAERPPAPTTLANVPGADKLKAGKVEVGRMEVGKAEAGKEEAGRMEVGRMEDGRKVEATPRGLHYNPRKQKE